MSSWVWLARLESADPLPDPLRPGCDAGGSAPVARASLSWPDGRRETMAAWDAGARPTPGARRADAALVDPAGPATRAVVQWLEEGRDPLFDDLAVQHALRMVAAWPAGPLTTLTRDSVHYSGAVQVVPGGRRPGEGHPRESSEWPLRLLGPTWACAVGPGLLATRTRTVHGTQRYRGLPWPTPARNGEDA